MDAHDGVETMKQRILIDAFLGQTTLALLEEGDLAELYVERPGMEKLTGNIYVGRVQNVLPGMNAAFLDIGLGKNAFLYAGDIRVDTRSDQGLADALRQMQIQKLVRPGQEIMVQVVKEPGGEKGPRVSSHTSPFPAAMPCFCRRCRISAFPAESTGNWKEPDCAASQKMPARDMVLA